MKKKILSIALVLVMALTIVPVIPSAAAASNDPVAVKISSGGAHTVAIDADGNLWIWGQNGMGQLGSGTIGGNTRRTPERIMEGTKFKDAIAFDGTTCAIDTDGGLWAWGAGYGVSPTKIDDDTIIPGRLSGLGISEYYVKNKNGYFEESNPQGLP